MDSFEIIVKAILSVPPAQVCKAFYIFAVVTILTMNFLPSDLRSLLVDYGARQQKSSRRNFLAKSIDSLQIPHSWFLHFYILSTGLSLFWGWQYVSEGWILETIATAQVEYDEGKEGMVISQVAVAWVLMAIHGGRRLYESLFVTKTGKTPMSSIHWIVGLVYYTAMSVSIWVEGSGAVLKSWETGEMTWDYPAVLPLAVGMFTTGSLKQHELHAHLASLKKYTLPSHGWFEHIICPHYTAECLIYFGLAVATAPMGQMLNKTVLLGLLFVAVNLGTTASGTKQWYAEKFGAEKVAQKWKMIPFIW